MKVVFIILVALTFGLATTTLAGEPPAAAKLPTDFKAEISKHINYPSFAQKDLIEGVVTMRLTLDDSSHVKIVELDATNLGLGNHVRNELAGLEIKNTSFEPGNIYYMKVRFNLISGF